MTLLRRLAATWLPYAFAWALARAYLGWEMAHRVGYIVGDVVYYHQQLSNGSGDITRILVEYPTPVVWALAALKAATGGGQAEFVAGFMMLMVALDATMAVLLWRYGGPRRGAAVFAWIVFVLFLGPLAYYRFDLAPALLAGAGALFVHRKPATAGGLIALGAALKLWPALLVLPLLGRGRERIRSAAAFLVTGAGLALASLVSSGWPRTVSPLTWQSDRGLQIEAVPATGVMWLRTFDPSTPYQVALSRYNAYEITGPGVGIALQVSTIATAVGMLVIAWLAWRVIRLTDRDAVTVAAVMLSVILIMIVTNKTLSPQYLFWLGGPVCAMVATARRSDGDVFGAPLLFTAAIWLAAIGTQQVYPTLYGELVGGRGSVLSTSILVLRNLGLVALTGVSVWYSALRTKRVETGS
jgi:hypothetical protein